MRTIRVEHLTKTYRRGTEPALFDISFQLESGDVCGLIGPNGAGKTTLLGCLLGLLIPDSGQVTFDGRSPDDIAVRRRTGYLPERLCIDRWMSGFEFLCLHHGLAGMPSSTRGADVHHALARVELSCADAKKQVQRYSRGMLQRLGLANALLGSPAYLFLDEPTSGMDPRGIALMRTLLDGVAASGTIVVLNSHQLDTVARVCTRIVYIEDGRIQSTQFLNARVNHAHVIRIRFLSSARSDAISKAQSLQLPLNMQLERIEDCTLFYKIQSEEAATLLVAMLLDAGLPVVEVGSMDSDLERLFRRQYPSLESAIPILEDQ